MYIRSFLTHTLAIVGVAAFILLTDCSSSPTGTDAPATPSVTGGVRAEDSSNLTRAEAQARKARLDQVSGRIDG